MSTRTKYFWLGWILYATLAYAVSLSATDAITGTVRTSSILIPQAIIFFLNYSYLAPKFLENNKRNTYFIIIVIILFLSAFLGGEMDLYLREKFPFFANGHHKSQFMPYVARFFMSLAPVIVSTLILKSILLTEKSKESFELRNKILEAETNALKAQINPHFLFNTLNNIYSLSQFDSKKTGEAILQLSDILRYVTYDGSNERVPLSSELENIESFIKLQLLKDSDASNIKIDIANDNPNLLISPLLLLPFVENCFKHANHHDKANGWIKIAVKTEGSKLIMVTSNSTTKQPSPKDKVGGVGMENVKRRLSLIYPNSHNLVIRIDKLSYTSTLEIDLS